MHLSLIHISVVVARVGDAADDGDGDLFHTDIAVDHIHCADQASSIAAGQLEELLADCLLYTSRCV